MLTHTIKSKLLCFNVDDTDVIPQTFLNGEVIPVVDSAKHLGNYMFIFQKKKKITLKSTQQ